MSTYILISFIESTEAPTGYCFRGWPFSEGVHIMPHRPRRPSHWRYLDRIRNWTKICRSLVQNKLYRSQRNFAQVTTMLLSWRVQNLAVIGLAYFDLIHCEFFSNFEFDRNTVSGTGAWTPPRLAPQCTPQPPNKTARRRFKLLVGCFRSVTETTEHQNTLAPA